MPRQVFRSLWPILAHLLRERREPRNIRKHTYRREAAQRCQRTGETVELAEPRGAELARKRFSPFPTSLPHSPSYRTRGRHFPSADTDGETAQHRRRDRVPLRLRSLLQPPLWPRGPNDAPLLDGRVSHSVMSANMLDNNRRQVTREDLSEPHPLCPQMHRLPVRMSDFLMGTLARDKKKLRDGQRVTKIEPGRLEVGGGIKSLRFRRI